MKLPIRPQTGKRIPKNWFRDLYDYIAAATSLRGDKKNIAVTMTDAGQVIRFIGDKSAPMGGAPFAPAYNGPFALYIENNTIKMKSGTVFVNGGVGIDTGYMTATGTGWYINLYVTVINGDLSFELRAEGSSPSHKVVNAREIGHYTNEYGLVQYVYSSYISFTFTAPL